MCNKWKRCFCILVLCFSLFFPIHGLADTNDSQKTEIKVELKEPISPNNLPGEQEQLSTKNTTSKKVSTSLPQTGEIMNHWYSCLGVFLVILVSTLFYSKTQQKKK
jgi:LPXTG-motif cell wall-anchored protein